ncbi:MAG: hypothetical protein RLZZ577_63 [Bacteroidota bacterium]|jgi:hypothetical protein
MIDNENLEMEIMEKLTANSHFVIENDIIAEALIRKIAFEKKEMKRQLQVIDYFIQEYELKKNEVESKFEIKTQNIINLLSEYFERVERKATKTQETYTLPSGKLKKKFGTVEYIKDDKLLLEWCKTNNRQDLIQIKETPMWAELKKEIQLSNGTVLTQDGEIIECIKTELKPDKFVVEVD